MNYKSHSRAHIAIVGGGIAGLSCAWALLRRGAVVRIYEAERAGRGALWASGGMLAAGFECAETASSQAFANLARRGMELWHDWANALGPESIGFRSSGVLAPATNDAEIDWLDELGIRARGIGFDVVEPSEMPQHINAKSALCFRGDGEIDNRLLGQRLIEIVRSAGGEIHENTDVKSMAPSGRRFAIQTVAGSQQFDQIILATGHQTSQFREIEPVLQELRPVKGQMLSLASADFELPCCLRAQNVYISQKRDRRFVIGASSETGRNDLSTDDGTISEMRARAERWVPKLRSLAETERWAGLRPATSDGQPILGAGTIPGVFLALGLYRNGVLLAPAIAELVADAVMTGATIPPAFRASRFGRR